MMDRFLARALWLTVMGMITAAAAAGLVLCFRGLIQMCGHQLQSGALAMGTGIVLAGIAYVLARHGDDLMDR